MSKFHKKKYNATRQAFLLTLFPHVSNYEELYLNGFWLVKHVVNGGPEMEVAIHTPSSYRAYKKLSILKEQMEQSSPLFPDQGDESNATTLKSLQDVTTQV